jgi:hypothetical protein
MHVRPDTLGGSKEQDLSFLTGLATLLVACLSRCTYRAEKFASSLMVKGKCCDDPWVRLRSEVEAPCSSMAVAAAARTVTRTAGPFCGACLAQLHPRRIL